MVSRETKSSFITFDPSRGYLKVTSKEVDEITMEDARHDFQQAGDMVNFQKTPVLADSRNYTHFDHEIRDFYSSKEAAERISAMAILINSIPTRLMGNFFINFHKPHFPTRLFTSENEAIKWLLKHTDEYKNKQKQIKETSV